MNVNVAKPPKEKMNLVSSVEVMALFSCDIFWLSCDFLSFSLRAKVLLVSEILMLLVSQALTISRWLLHKAERFLKCGDTPVNLFDVCSWAVSYFHTATLLFLLLQISSFNCWPQFFFCFFVPYPHKSHVKNGGSGRWRHQLEGKSSKVFELRHFTRFQKGHEHHTY